MILIAGMSDQRGEFNFRQGIPGFAWDVKIACPTEGRRGARFQVDARVNLNGPRAGTQCEVSVRILRGRKACLIGR
jgi:hypothetical protein